MTDEMVNDFATNFALAASLPMFAATLVYGIGSPWYKSWLGRVILLQWVSIVITFGVILGRRLFGEYPGHGYVAVTAYGLLFIAFTATLVIILIERRAPAPHTESESLMSHVEITKRTVPEIWYKGQRVLRSLFTTVLTVLPLVPQVVAIVQGQWEASWLTGVAVQAVAINTALTGIIALPTVNAWLTKIGLGSVPRKAVTEGEVVPAPAPGA